MTEKYLFDTNHSSLITRKAPDFKAKVVTPDGSVKDIVLSEYIKEAGVRATVLFFYPLDFTFVCPTEILAFNNKIEEFRKRNVALLGISIDSHFAHLAWRNTDINNGGIGKVNYPLISDISHQISKSYGVYLDEASVSLRGLFLLDKDMIVRHQVINDLPLGRSVEEVLRMIDALFFFEDEGEVCPANWKKGKSGIVPTKEGIEDYLISNISDIVESDDDN